MRWFSSWVPPVAYMATTWALSSLQRTPVDAASFPLGDKGMHFVEYAVLGLLLGRAFRRTWPAAAWWRRWTVALVACVGWGVLDELHQAFVPGRSPDPLDAVADFVGAVAGVALGSAFAWLLRPRAPGGEVV